MSIEGLQEICDQLPNVTQSIKLFNHLCFEVGGKGFLYTYPESVPTPAAFKVPDEEFEEIIAREGIRPHPYVARYKWVEVTDINVLNRKEWEHYIKQSYDLIASKLPKKTRKAIGLE
jgi:predicted DNA-binding protein (MmcQ/YjbR family)